MKVKTQMNVGLTTRNLKSLSRDEICGMLSMYRECMQLACSKLGLAVHMEKVSAVRKELPQGLSSMMYSPCYNWLGDEYFRADVFSLCGNRMPERLLVFSKAQCWDEDQLHDMLRSNVSKSKSVLQAQSILDEMLLSLPANSPNAPSGADVFELGVCMVMEEILTSPSYWVVRYQGAVMAGSKTQFSYGVMDSRFTKFCGRPEFDLKVNANGTPVFKEVLV